MSHVLKVNNKVNNISLIDFDDVYVCQESLDTVKKKACIRDNRQYICENSTLLCDVLKAFMKAFNAFVKPFEAQQNSSVKIKI